MNKENSKILIKISYNDRKKAINLSKIDTFKEFDKIINENILNISNTKYVIKILDEIFFDEFTFKKFYKNIINKYENNPNDFSAKNAPIGTIEIVDEYPEIYKLLNNEEIIEMLESKEKEILGLKNENNKLKNELEIKKIKNNNNNQENELNINNNNENKITDFGIKFDMDSKKGDYDIIIDIQSIKIYQKQDGK